MNRKIFILHNTKSLDPGESFHKYAFMDEIMAHKELKSYNGVVKAEYIPYIGNYIYAVVSEVIDAKDNTPSRHASVHPNFDKAKKSTIWKEGANKFKKCARKRKRESDNRIEWKDTKGNMHTVCIIRIKVIKDVYFKTKVQHSNLVSKVDDIKFDYSFKGDRFRSNIQRVYDRTGWVSRPSMYFRMWANVYIKQTKTGYIVHYGSVFNAVLPANATLNDIFACIEKHAKKHNIEIKFGSTYSK